MRREEPLPTGDDAWFFPAEGVCSPAAKGKRVPTCSAVAIPGVPRPLVQVSFTCIVSAQRENLESHAIRTFVHVRPAGKRGRRLAAAAHPP